MSTIALIELIATILGGASNLLRIVQVLKAENRDKLTKDEVAKVADALRQHQMVFNDSLTNFITGKSS